MLPRVEVERPEREERERAEKEREKQERLEARREVRPSDVVCARISHTISLSATENACRTG